MSGGSEIGQMPVGERTGAAPRVRLDWIDALKGLGIVMVVAGHVWTRGAMRDAFYAVHMPLFFVLAGYTARYTPWTRLLGGSLRSLGLPFLCFSALLLAADFAIEGARGVRPIFASWEQGAATILFATEKLRGPFTILWFIPCLFLTRLGWNALAANGRRVDAPIVLVAMLGVAGVAVALPHLLTRSPLGLLAVPGALLFVWAGSLWRLRGMPGRVGMGACALLMLPTVSLLPPFNMKIGDLGFAWLSVPGAAAATILLAWLTQHFSGPLMRATAALGRASLVIMYLHVAFIHYLAPYASRWTLFVVALGLPFAIDHFIRLSPLARRLLLGEMRTRG